MKYIKNFIGMLVRDVVVYLSNDYVEYYYEDNTFIYKTFLPYSFTIGMYKFLKEDDYSKQK